MLSYFEKKLTAKGIYGIFPANQVNDDDIELTPALEGGVVQKQVFLTLRQQAQKTKGA
jgi:5-methyltetrahydrofolate--homocysteine methyltransferase